MLLGAPTTPEHQVFLSKQRRHVAALDRSASRDSRTDIAYAASHAIWAATCNCEASRAFMVGADGGAALVVNASESPLVTRGVSVSGAVLRGRCCVVRVPGWLRPS